MKRLAFYGRVSTEDQQDPDASRGWQLSRARQLVEPADCTIVDEFFDLGRLGLCLGKGARRVLASLTRCPTPTAASTAS